ncbi:Photosystem I chlorophyll a apoprotein A1 [Capsicum baccatum]|uniref:Photosystem I chlorophyll a apoprotein A1 n=1 Tax=Capsicum baccatum TaxID=33114 RepID=A0A2G2VN13_CAPBA|nr:Photosystem I chlorophyll a apoprotein A1 [Capsicum baccatum]
MGRLGHSSRTIAKGPDTTTWIWNLHAVAHDFDSHTSDLKEISQKVFSSYFGQLSIIFLWMSGIYFHGAHFSNYEARLSDPTYNGPSGQVVWPIVGQEILNAIGALVFTALMLFAGWFHYHKVAPKLAWFQDVESMLNHYLAGLLKLGSLCWAGHQVHVSLPINQFLNAGVDPKEIPLPHEFILNQDLLGQLYPSFTEGSTPFFTLNWSKYVEFLTFSGGLDPVTGGALFARSSRLILDKANLGFHFPCDGPGRGGICQVSAWDHVFLELFWMYNSISVVIFHFSWKMQSDVWGSVSDQGVVTHITGGNFAQSSITINGWLRDFLWAQASQGVLDQLSGMGVKFDEEIHELWLLNTLPDSLETLRIYLTNFALNSIVTIEYAKSSILNKEMRKRSRASSSHSDILVTEESGRNKSRG